MKNKIIISFFILLVLAVAVYLYTYKGHRDIAAEQGSFSVVATTLFTEFKSNEQTASAKYLDKTIAVSGSISAIDSKSKSIVINEKLFVLFTDEIPETIKTNTAIKIKGRFIGYDELLEEMKMDQCVIIE
ncbi:OB-fold protein [Flavobacterium sp.]|uniref:OB-fold protein n=1 Tax=Flavobacterium sp. TaxID=239 RepID=UPI00286A8FC0|nr:hypothetical protein [Flavobacterium sp.]